MHHETVLASRRLLDAFLFGGRLALFVACMGLIAIFWLSARRYFACVLRRREVIFGDQLGAGIWLTAAGMILSDLVRLAISTAWRGDVAGLPIGRVMMILGIVTILGGYVLHFRAWAAVVRPAYRHISFYWTIGLALAAAAGVTLMLGLS